MEVGPEIIQQYFPALSERQVEYFGMLGPLYRHWNSQVNVISRKDIAELYVRHILHSLGIAKVCAFMPGETVLDIGTGGGFPGIPLAIMFPDTHFTLVDSIGKKIMVVNQVATALGLSNVTALHTRAEGVNGPFNFIISRAVTRLASFYPWCYGKITPRQLNSITNGILYLKGGSLAEEVAEGKLPATGYALSRFFTHDFFETKQVLHIPLNFKPFLAK